MYIIGRDQSQIRYALRQWWHGLGKSSEVCGIYNDGRQLFIEDKHIPGTFISPPSHLSHWPFVTSVIVVNSMWLIHRGHHSSPALQAVAYVSAFDGSTILNLEIPRVHLVYIIRGVGKIAFHWRMACVPLPRHLLGS